MSKTVNHIGYRGQHDAEADDRHRGGIHKQCFLTATRRDDLKHGTNAAYVAGCACNECREHQRQRMARQGRLLHGGDLGRDCGSVPFDLLGDLLQRFSQLGGLLRDCLLVLNGHAPAQCLRTGRAVICRFDLSH